MFDDYQDLLVALEKHVVETKHHRFEYWRVLRGHAFDCESCGQVFEHNLSVKGQEYRGTQVIAFVTDGRLYITSGIESGHAVEVRRTRYDRDFVI